MLVNGEQRDTIAIMDRGFQYGDGLFETIEVRENTPIFLEQHLQRLNVDSQRLYLPKLDLDLLHSEIQQICKNAGNSVLKIIITRGSGGRGYRQPDVIQPTRILSLHPFPDYPKSFYTDGIVTRLCETRLGLNPTLAGMKHLNRLEQIMARAEWNNSEIHEGIMLDFDRHVIEGTMTNLFYAKDGELFTALLKNCGIAGILRGWIFEQINVIEHNFFLDDLREADEIFVCNSIMGICGVRQIEQQHLKIGEITQKLQVALQVIKSQLFIQ
ncbi:MAG: aminodeoxychorismate lyase [Methylococcales bacterium]|nr:aminodeoxychorismate lyase [Methylococcales bacterium]MDD5755077.1 aminodeoxychorismate lyase [Methylococcales bacterium]